MLENVRKINGYRKFDHSGTLTTVKYHTKAGTGKLSISIKTKKTLAPYTHLHFLITITTIITIIEMMMKIISFC